MSLSIATVAIGNPGNTADRNGLGWVDHNSAIGTHEVTISQYSQFLNAVAASDPYQLYNPSLMTNALNGGIKRSGSDGNYSYIPTPGTERYPITGLSWLDAARFANWLSNGQPAGVQTALTTEDGACTMSPDAINRKLAVTRNTIDPNTQKAVSHFIPTENKWYKSAYFNPDLNQGAGGY